MECYINRKVVEQVFTEDSVSLCGSNTIFTETAETVSDIFKNGVSTQKNKQLLMCLLCSAIYRYDSFFYHLINFWGLDKKDFKIIDIDEGSLVYGRYTFEGGTVYFFKGSSSIKDSLANIDMLQTKDTLLEGKVHRGFHGVLSKNSRYLDIVKDIFSLPKGAKVYLTGHSLGGALATIMSCYVNDIVDREVELITFGCPRVGDSVFSRQIKDSSRIVNGDDAVCRLPLPISYRHSEKKELLGKESFFGFSLRQHSIDSYYNSLSRI